MRMQMLTAGKIHLESKSRDQGLGDEGVNGRIAPPERKSGSTSQGKVKLKNEIVIGNQCRYWAADLFKQYGLPVPGWLRARFRINQRRRKMLNELLWEANVGHEYCGHCQASDRWDYHLHCLYHIVNGSSPCL